MLDKTYLPADIESKIYRAWEAAGHFACAPKSGKPPYCVMMPPPNVTGSLHMGHALNSTLQDVLTRYRRKMGRDALWQPGMDHAGIATQMVVERQLGEEGVHRRDLGREAFVERVWQWKGESGGAIANQLRRLGASPDWARDRFTMDEGLSHAVRTVFVTLHEQGLIYRDKRLVNWDPKLHTAISDLEVEPRETDGHLWHFRYPIEGRAGEFITVATTRPETMLGDTAVAVHPEDERWKSLIGGYATLPLVGRRLILVADEHADPEQGSGAVKITPAHDFNDFEVARRHDLERINIFDADARLNDNVPEPYRGMDRYEARDKVIADMEALGLVEKVEPHRHALPYGDRSGVVVEPWLTDQWFADAETLAKPGIEAVEDGRIRFVPKQWENTYFEWMRNIQPWCISRQLWWGHRIPAWYGPDGAIFVAMDEAGAVEKAEAHYGKAVELSQDEDVLDTWFSSGLWPFSTLGWPEKSEALETYYPNDDLVTGFDIIFFWVARMIMLGMHFMGDVPFRTVYIHALVRDEQGQKMSKSKGNVIDPLELIDRYGADAMRFTLAAMEAQGRDIKMSESRVEGYRNFATKLWNAVRFCQGNGIGASESIAAPDARLAVNSWIIGEVIETKAEIEKALADLRFDAAASAIYHFVWDRFCDWYLELIKPVLSPLPPAGAAGGGSGADQASPTPNPSREREGDWSPLSETKAVAGWAIDQILVMLHPFMPFVTEELWHAQAQFQGGERPYELMLAAWPDPQAEVDADAVAAIDWVIALTTATRAAKNELGIAPGAKLEAWLPAPSPLAARVVERSAAAIERLARLTPLHLGEDAPAGPVMQIAAGEDAVIIPLEGIVDVEAEKARLTKAMEASQKEFGSLDKRLSNPAFVEKAKPEAVEKAKADAAFHASEIDRLRHALARLG